MTKKILTYLMIAAMAFLCAVSYQLFVFPNHFAPAGLNGLCTMIQYVFGVSIGYLNLLIEVNHNFRQIFFSLQNVMIFFK